MAPVAEMVILARESRGQTQAALADRTGFTQGYISKIENGLLDPTPDRLGVIAEKLEFPVSLFFVNEPIVSGAVAVCHYRRRQSATVATLRRLNAHMHLVKWQCHRLLRGVELAFHNDFVRMDIDEYESPEQIAQMLRHMWGIPYGPLLDLTHVVEAAGGIVMKDPFGTDRVDEMSVWPQDGQPFFFMNLAVPADRYRLSLAHGIGHLVMHALPTPDRDIELDAMRFAGEFLAPGAEIEPELHDLSFAKLAQLKAKWRMAMQALIERAYRLGTLSDRQRRSFYTRLSQMGYRKREPHPLAAEEPRLIGRIVQHHQQQNGYTADELAAAVHLLPHEFRRRFMPASRNGRLQSVN